MEEYYGKGILIATFGILLFFAGKLWDGQRNIPSYEEDPVSFQQNNTKEHHYLIRNAQEFFTILWGCLCAALCITFLMSGIRDKIFSGILFGMPCLLGVLNVLVWKVEVRGEDICYRSTFGTVRHYYFSQITHGCYKRSGAFRVYSGRKRLFTFDDNVAYERFLSELYSRNIPIDSLGGKYPGTRRSRIAASFSTVVFNGIMSTCGMILGFTFFTAEDIRFYFWGIVIILISLLPFFICYFQWIDVENEKLTYRFCFLWRKTFSISSITSYRQKKFWGFEILYFYAQGKFLACIPMKYDGATWLLAKVQKNISEKKKTSHNLKQEKKTSHNLKQERSVCGR